MDTMLGLIQCPWEPGSEAAEVFERVVVAMKQEYDIGSETDKPQRQLLIQRIAVMHTRLFMQDMAGEFEDSYRRDQNALGRAISELAKYTEAIKVMFELKRAQDAQAKLLSVVQQLCPDCLKMVRGYLRNAGH